MKIYWVDYGGQSTDGFESIGTDKVKIPITPNMDMNAALTELKRRCGRNARIRLYKQVPDSVCVET